MSVGQSQMSSISTLIEASSSAAVLLGFFKVHASPRRSRLFDLEIATAAHWDIYYQDTTEFRSPLHKRISGDDRCAEWRPRRQSVWSQPHNRMSFSGCSVFRKHHYIEPRSRRCQHHEEHYGRLFGFQKEGGRYLDNIKTVRFDGSRRISQRSCFIVSRPQS